MCLFCGLQIAIDCLLPLMQVSVGHPNFLFGAGGGSLTRKLYIIYVDFKNFLNDFFKSQCTGSQPI